MLSLSKHQHEGLGMEVIVNCGALQQLIRCWLTRRRDRLTVVLPDRLQASQWFRASRAWLVVERTDVVLDTASLAYDQNAR
jgi:hypothetical protein